MIPLAHGAWCTFGLLYCGRINNITSEVPRRCENGLMRAVRVISELRWTKRWKRMWGQNCTGTWVSADGEPQRAAQASGCETVLMVDDRALSFLWLMCLSYLYWGRAFPVLKLCGDASEFRLLWCCDLSQKLFWWLVLIVLKWIAFCCQGQNHIFSSSDAGTLGVT